MKEFLDRYSDKPANFFKQIFVLYSFGYIPFLLLQIILNATYLMPVNYNDEHVYGIKGILVLICFSPFVVLLFSIMTWLSFFIGILIMKFLKKNFYA